MSFFNKIYDIMHTDISNTSFTVEGSAPTKKSKTIQMKTEMTDKLAVDSTVCAERRQRLVTEVMLNIIVSLMIIGQCLVIRSSCSFAVYKQYYQHHYYYNSITESMN